MPFTNDTYSGEEKEMVSCWNVCHHKDTKQTNNTYWWLAFLFYPPICFLFNQEISFQMCKLMVKSLNEKVTLL